MSMGTPKQPEETKRTLLTSAVKLMRKKGYEATSVDDICREAKLTKGSFFHHFKDKEELAMAALDSFCNCQGTEMSKRKGEKDPLARVDGLIDRIVDMASSTDTLDGCLIGNFAQEVSETHPELRKACAGKFGDLARYIKKELDEAKKLYAPKGSVDTESLAYHFISVLQGSNVVAKATQDPKVIGRNMRHLKQYFHAVFKK